MARLHQQEFFFENVKTLLLSKFDKPSQWQSSGSREQFLNFVTNAQVDIRTSCRPNNS